MKTTPFSRQASSGYQQTIRLLQGGKVVVDKSYPAISIRLQLCATLLNVSQLAGREKSQFVKLKIRKRSG
ncbi:hypothetical protein [Dryocola sp. LX212]